MWLTLKIGGSGILEWILHLLLTGSSLEGSRPPCSLAHAPPCCGTSPAAPYSWAPAQTDATEYQFTVQHITTHTHNLAHTLSCCWKRARESLRNTGGGGAAAGSNWGAEWGGGVSFHWGGGAKEMKGMRRCVCVRRWVWGGREEEMIRCMRRWVRGGECKEVEKLGSGSVVEEQGLKGAKKGRRNTKGVKVRRWTAGLSPSDCCFATSSQMWEGPYLIWSLSKQKKMAEKFTDLFFLFSTF